MTNNKKILALGKKLTLINPTRFSSMKNLAIISFVLIIVSLLLITNVSASGLRVVCLKRGEALPSAQNPRYVCEHDSCQVCVNSNNYPKYDKNCPVKDSCDVGSGNSTIGEQDIIPPVLTILSPVEGQVYNNKNVAFNLKSNEPVTFYYEINDKGSFSRLVANVLSYLKSLSFKDGMNKVRIKAMDANNNEAILVRNFIVDSAKPKISKTLPSRGFANGKFEVWFTEQNPSIITLDYGNIINGRKIENIPVSSCTHDGAKYYCNINVALNEYNNQNIDYKFKVNDIAGNYHESKAVLLKVDNALPIITNSPIYSLNGKYLTFSLNINEANFGSVSYYDNSLLRARWKKICTSLKNGACVKKTTFSKGTHVVDVQVSDKAGNSVVQRIIFDVNY